MQHGASKDVDQATSLRSISAPKASESFWIVVNNGFSETPRFADYDPFGFKTNPQLSFIRARWIVGER
jgi:hypothetical protein